MQRLESKNYLLLIIFITSIFLSLSWFVSDPVRAAKIDRYFLYSVDDIFRYCHIKASAFNGLVFLSPYVKIGYAIVARIFYGILPFGMDSLRIMNVLFSAGILILVYKLTKKLYILKSASYIAILLTVTFPIYFLVSISTLSEVMFCFFLIWAIYLFYIERYNTSILLASLLPLFRQEGIIFLFIWGYLLKNLSQTKKIALLFVPFSFWMILILFQNIFNDALLWLIPSKPPPNSAASLLQSLNLIAILTLHPLIILCLIGLIINLSNEKFKLLKICFVSYIFFLAIFQAVHFLKFKLFCRELRIMMPTVPLMAIYGSSIFDRLFRKFRNYRGAFITALAVILIIIMSYQIIQLQKDPFVIVDSLTAKQEIALRNTNAWLNDYLSKENIKKVYVPDILTTHKIIRRLWMYIPGYIGFYATPSNNLEESMDINKRVLDMIILKFVSIENGTKGVFISTQIDNEDKTAGKVKYKLLKEMPDISLYFYLVEGQ